MSRCKGKTMIQTTYNPGPLTTEDKMILFKDLLVEGPCSITYYKIDGSTREARGTLNTSLIPSDKLPKSNTSQKAGSDDVQRYYDLNVNGWRSFIVGNVISIKPE